MKKMANKSFIIIPLVFILIISSCAKNTVDITRPMFAVSAPAYKDSKTDSRCVIGGVYFDFYNRADCSVIYLETRMNVYDRGTQKNAFAGYGTLENGSSLVIKSGEKKQLCVSLDDYITAVSKEGYCIDQFYISRIEYEDGRVWIDNFGLYALSSGE